MAELKGYQQLQARLHAVGQTELTMRRVGMMTVREAKLLVHRKTGNTGRSIHVASASATRAVVEAGAAAVFLERGTRPHEITPKAARALRFAATAAGRRLTGSPRIGAAVVFAKHVHHPGTQPYPFLMPGARKAIERGGLTNAITESWNKAT